MNEQFDRDKFVFNRDVPTIMEQKAKAPPPDPPFLSVYHHILPLSWSAEVERWVMSEFRTHLWSGLIVPTGVPVNLGIPLNHRFSDIHFVPADANAILTEMSERGCMYLFIIGGDRLPDRGLMEELYGQERMEPSPAYASATGDLVVLNRGAIVEMAESVDEMSLDQLTTNAIKLFATGA